MVESVGIIGFGSFGRLISELVPKDVEVLIYRASNKPVVSDRTNVRAASLTKTVQSNILIPCIPLGAYNETFKSIAGDLKPETLLIDVCSVKSLPQQLIDKYFPNHPNLLMTHPLFGPQSVAHGTEGLSLITTLIRGSLAQSVIDYCDRILKLKIISLTSQEHDQEMAFIHALTFFLARGLLKSGVEPQPIMTPSYKRLLELAELESHHSDELFETIQKGNPYAAAVRNKFINVLKELDSDISS